jgi:hypothetical protein
MARGLGGKVGFREIVVRSKKVADGSQDSSGRRIDVVRSDHPAYVKGSRFDYGFAKKALGEGYTVVFLPQRRIR